MSKDNFSAFEVFHSNRISIIVLPVMVVELFTGGLLIFTLPDFLILSVANFCLLGATWLTTLFVSARIHGQLVPGYDQQKVDRLVRTNWPRTFLWTSRAIALTYLLPQLLSA